MEHEERILINRISKQCYVNERVKIACKSKGCVDLIYVLLVFVISVSTSSEARRFLLNDLGVGVLLCLGVFLVIGFLLIERNKASRYYNLHMGKQGEEQFVLLPKGLRRHDEENIISWVSLSKVKKKEGIISFHKTWEEFFIWNEECISAEIKEYLETKLRGMKE
ncbi:hypothetical protein QTL86_00710 [Cellulosilyticum sp. ST5]|uniref:hypothetical protein n=1 Tax=Cellulosilyticum sp. ST5 TaxID=3055805 RepID=UPI0039779643